MMSISGSRWKAARGRPQLMGRRSWHGTTGAVGSLRRRLAVNSASVDGATSCRTMPTDQHSVSAFFCNRQVVHVSWNTTCDCVGRTLTQNAYPWGEWQWQRKVTTYQPDTKSNRNPNRNPKPIARPYPLVRPSYETGVCKNQTFRGGGAVTFLHVSWDVAVDRRKLHRSATTNHIRRARTTRGGRSAGGPTSPQNYYCMSLSNIHDIRWVGR